MKYLKYLLIILLVPFIVLAEECDISKITITSMEQNSIEGNTEVISEPTFKDRSISLNLKMYEVGDSITYDMTIKNDSNEDYMIDEDTFKTDSDYIEYSLKTNDNSNIVKAKSSKSLSLVVTYKKEIDKTQLTNNKYNASNSLKLSMNTSEQEKELEVITTDNIKESIDPVKESNNTKIDNPITSDNIKLITIILLTVIAIIFLTIINKKKYNKYLILVLSITLLPMVYAVCKCDIEVESTIEIEKTIICGSFSEDSWDIISYNINNNNDDCYQVGNTKEIDMGEYGTHILRIANKSTPEKCNENGFSQTACGLVLEFADIITNHRMNPTDTNEGGWPASEMRTYVNNDIYNALPIDLKNMIIDTLTVSGYSWKDSANFISTDNLYLLSTHEVFEADDGSYYFDTAYNSTRQLDYYAEANDMYPTSSRAIKQYNNSNYNWWFRTPYSYNCASYFGFYDCGYVDDGNAGYTCGVSPAFRIR